MAANSATKSESGKGAGMKYFPWMAKASFWRSRAGRLASRDTEMPAATCAFVESSRVSRRVVEL
jgi:hypothetical protein